jgi:hypothetical protein
VVTAVTAQTERRLLPVAVEVQVVTPVTGVTVVILSVVAVPTVLVVQAGAALVF